MIQAQTDSTKISVTLLKREMLKKQSIDQKEGERKASKSDR